MRKLTELAYPLAILLVAVMSGGTALAEPKAARKQNKSTLHSKPIYGAKELNALDKRQKQIMDEFGTLDVTTPEGRRRQRWKE